jgi:hypothetical protein
MQAKSAKDLVALMDAMMVPHSSEGDSPAPHRSFKIKANFGTLRIGFVEPTIWQTWRKSGRINADAERFMVSRPVPCRKLDFALCQCVSAWWGLSSSDYTWSVVC